MEHNPFIYGKEVSRGDFWDREKERRELKRDIQNGQSVVIFSKRRMGKTSLIKEVLRILPEGRFITAYVDMYPTASVEDFVSRYATAMGLALSGPLDKVLSEIKLFLKSFTPLMTIDDEGKPVVTLDFGRHIKKEFLLEEVLEAFPKYCQKKKKAGVFVLDEFQQIAVYDKDRKLEATLRSHFQTHKNVSYIFLGSKRHLLAGIFSLPNRPFYHSAKMFPLGDIDPVVLTNCVKERFIKTGCQVSHDDAEYITDLAEKHPYYTQRLAHTVWNSIIAVEDRTVDKELTKNAFNLIVQESTDYYRSICELLTPHQLRALRTAAHIGPAEKIFSKEFLNKHGWQKDSLKQTLDALVEKDILSRESGAYKIDDIFLRTWLITTE